MPLHSPLSPPFPAARVKYVCFTETNSVFKVICFFREIALIPGTLEKSRLCHLRVADRS